MNLTKSHHMHYVCVQSHWTSTYVWCPCLITSSPKSGTSISQSQSKLGKSCTSWILVIPITLIWHECGIRPPNIFWNSGYSVYLTAWMQGRVVCIGNGEGRGGEGKGKIKWQQRGVGVGKRNLRGTKFKHHFTRKVDSVLKLLCKCYSVNFIRDPVISKQYTVISGRVQCGEWVAGTLAWMWLSIMVACLDPVDCAGLSSGS